MKMLLIMAVVILASLPISARSEDSTCRRTWMSMQSTEKAFWLDGYLSAVSLQGGLGDALVLPKFKHQEEFAIAALALKKTDDKQRIGQILRDFRERMMWPKDYTLGVVVSEMDLFCNRPENGETSLLSAMSTITLAKYKKDKMGGSQ